MKQWVFVHNDEGGLPADAVKRLEKFKADNQGLETGQHGFQELSDIAGGKAKRKRPIGGGDRAYQRRG